MGILYFQVYHKRATLRASLCWRGFIYVSARRLKSSLAAVGVKTTVGTSADCASFVYQGCSMNPWQICLAQPRNGRWPAAGTIISIPCETQTGRRKPGIPLRPGNVGMHYHKYTPPPPPPTSSDSKYWIQGTWVGRVSSFLGITSTQHATNEQKHDTS